MKKWQMLATTNFTVLEDWFGEEQLSNIGLVLGDGLVALDVDVKSGGPATLAELEAKHGPLPRTPTQRTGSGGQHFLFRLPPLGDIRVGNRTGFLPGLDLKADNGQIIVEPSANELGGRYSWLSGLAPWEVDIAEIPQWLLLILIQGSKPKHQVGHGKVGTRNVSLHRAGSRLRGRGAEEPEITAALIELNKQFEEPLDHGEVLTIIRSVSKYPKGTPAYTWNDSGNARRFVDENEGTIRFAVDEGTWLLWSGKCWLPDRNGSVMALFQDMVEAMRIEALQIELTVFDGDKARKAALSWARKCGDAGRIAGGLRLAEADQRIVVELAAFDNLPGLLPVENGVVDLRTGELLPHDPGRLVTKVAPVRYTPSAKAPRFRQLLDFALPGELQIFVQVYLGYALVGDPVEQRFVVFKGEGGNGKSVLTNVVAKVVGPFVARTSTETFMDTDNASKGGTRPDLLALRGHRLVIASEVASRRRLDAQTIKYVAGGEPLVARGLYSKTPTTFPVTFTVVTLTNPHPHADEGDGGLWRRLLLVPFDFTVPQHEINRTLTEDILREEAEGVLAWLVEGARRYAEHGLPVPAEIEERTKQWRREVGTMQRYIETQCTNSPASSEPLSELHRWYQNWCRCNSTHPLGLGNFKIRLQELGHRVDQLGACETVFGIRRGAK